MPGAPGGAGAVGAGGARGGAGADNSREPKSVIPGLVVLGLGNKDSLERKAKGQNLDVLIIFEVKVAQSLKTNIVTNTSKLSIFAVQKPDEMVFTSAGINAVAVTKQREKPKDNDPLDVEVERAMATSNGSRGQELCCDGDAGGVNARTSLAASHPHFKLAGSRAAGPPGGNSRLQSDEPDHQPAVSGWSQRADWPRKGRDAAQVRQGGRS
jgi:hypothetical protein